MKNQPQLVYEGEPVATEAPKVVPTYHFPRLTEEQLEELPEIVQEIIEVDRELEEWRAEPVIHITWARDIRALKDRKKELAVHAAKTFGADIREHD